MSDQPYEVSARKYRPRTFAEVVGQDHITRTLQNSLRSGKIHHAFLFTGPRGTGKTTTARLLAMALNCRTSETMAEEPCGQCESCQVITGGNSVDVLEIDGASNNSVDQIRELRETVGYAAFEGRYKVYIIDEVHMLTSHAFNALLKTLEEPPKHVVFIFATTEPGKVLATIMSRVQRYDFRRIGVGAITDTLKMIAEKEGIDAEDDALHLIARKAEGSLRDAESLLDQVRSFAVEKITLEEARNVLGIVDSDRLFQLTRLSVEQDASGALELAERLAEEGQDPREFMLSYAEHLRNLIAASVGGEAALELLTQSEREKYLDQVDKLSTEDYLRRFETVSQAAQALRDSPQPWIALEVTFLKLIHMDRAVDIRELIDRIDENLEGGSSGSAAGSGGAGAGTGQRAGSRSGSADTTSGARASGGGGRQDRTASPPAPPPAGVTESARPPAPSSPRASGDGTRVVREGDPPVPPPDVYEQEMEDSRGGQDDSRGGNGRGTPLAEVQAHWQDILEEVRRRKVSLFAFLTESEVVNVEANHVVLAFRGENHTFHINMVNRHADMIREITRDILGHALGVRCVKAEERKGSRVSGGQQAPRDVNEELLERLCEKDQNLKQIVDIFEARLEDGPGGRPDA
jgi:DNA polymerase-3 subunit gamma/tau